MIDERSVVAVVADRAAYPSAPPFSPSDSFPEYSYELSSEDNAVYRAVRHVFEVAGFDSEALGTPRWNPLGDLLREGETVVLKPNLIKESHPRFSDGWKCVLTHGSVVRAVADYVFRAVGPAGRVIVADAPSTDSSFTKIVKLLGLDQLVAYYGEQGLQLELIDLRREEWTNERGVIVDRRPLPGDPRGNVAFDLGPRSEFHTHRGAGSYYGADYDARVVNEHHSGGRHEYLISSSVMQADAIISLPKLKTHKKTGITVSLKNLVGVNGDKNWLPHHTEGSPARGGDEHPNPGLLHRLERSSAAVLRRMSLALPRIGPRLHQRARAAGKHVFGDTEDVIRSGNWWGNDTVWRMCLDLNKIVLYGNADGTFREPIPANRRRHFALVDGVIAGEGSGPMNPDPKPIGLLLFGLHPATVDAAAAVLMGFDPELIPIVREAFGSTRLPIAEWGWRDVRLESDRTGWKNRTLGELDPSDTFGFAAHFGWAGHIERSVKSADA